MHWVVGTWLISSLLGLGTGHNTLFEGYGTLSGYHLCNVTELVSVTNVISFPTSLTQRRPCGGWLPWKMCDVTVYKTEYHTQVYNMSKQVMKCCHGYEQVGSYCAVSLNRSAEFTSKPGLCPSASVTGSLRNHSTSGSMCKWDIDCPQWQKCCQKENISNIYQCSNPVPANRTCFNVTITVKTSFQLVTMDKGLFNHTRLLYSMVTGALETADTSVHHVRSWSAGPFTTSSSLLVCSNVFFLGDISTRLNHLGNIEEVTDVGVQDVDPCSVPELNSCSPDADCMNTAGYSSCVCHHGYEDLNPSQPGTVCIRKALSTTLPFTNTTTTPPRTTLPPTGNTTYTDGEQMSTIPSGGDPSTITDPSSHSNNPPHRQPASTCDGQTLLVTARFTNMNYTVALSDQTSETYKTFCKAVLDEILLSSPPDLQALLISKQVTIQITSLSAGSVIVNFSITFQNGSNPNMSSIATDLVSLRNSKYTVGNISIHMQDSPNATTTINPTTNYPGVSSTASSTAKSSITATQFGNPSMSSTHTARPQTNTNTTGPSTATTNTLTTNTQHSTTIPITPNPFGHQGPNITGSLVSYITVECRISNTSVFIRKEGLQAYGVPENALYLGEPQCVVNGRNESHVWLTAAWDKCNTTREQNSNHTSFNLILYNNFSVAPNVHLKVPIICTYPSDIIISMGYGALTGYMINGLVAGFGRFQATLRLMNGMSPLPENYAFSKDEEVIVEVGLNPTVPQINPVINRCWVTSGQDSTVSRGPEFLIDGCAVANLPTTVLQNGNDSVSLLSVRIFSLMDKDVIFLHCEIQICFETQDNTCTPDCLRSASRSYGSAEATASIGPLNRLLEASPQNDTSTALPTVGFVLLGVGVFLLSLAAIAGLVCHKRKIGNYNFNLNPQQENFSYHVFST
ncbi:uromodulin-like 1 [Pseudorasbora parva]|uniref:uromodulin-like 1 n=1 Tax=Pseudorasbora parva TaxID=51549 RepID=UPI00351E2351